MRYSFECVFHRTILGLAVVGGSLELTVGSPCLGQSTDYSIGGLPISMSAPCNNEDSIYPGGEYCIAATSSATGNNPRMPVLSYSYDPGDSSTCNRNIYDMDISFSQPGDIYGDGQSYGAYNSATDLSQDGTGLPGTTPWVVNWSNNLGDKGWYSQGGDGTLSTYRNGVLISTITFKVWGQNPSNQSIAAYLTGIGAPWWFGHLLTQESSNRQFYIWQSQTDPSGRWTGTPIFGPKDGFGLAQIDGSCCSTSLNDPLNDNVLWTWTTNLAAGVQKANSLLSRAQNFWGTQWSEWQNWASQNPSQAAVNSPFELVCGSAYFTPAGTGNSQYFNLFQIEAYNTGSIDNNNAFASVNPNTGVWNYNSDYAVIVCSQSSTTLPD